MSRKILYFITLLICLSCDRIPSDSQIIDPDSYFEHDNQYYPDSLLIDIAYNGPKYVEGFFHEDLSNILFNIIGEFIEYDSVSSWYEPAVSDIDSARKLVNKRIEGLGNDISKIIEGRHTEKYFEFVYPEYHITTSKDFYLRVHHSNYFDGVYYSYEDETNGHILYIGQRHLTEYNEIEVKEFFQRLWFYYFQHRNGAKVIENYIAQKDNYFHFVIYYITIVRGDLGVTDEITLTKSEYLLNENTGFILIKNQNLLMIDGHPN
jgi:hypothetical protein